jgi:hypothetical protein
VEDIINNNPTAPNPVGAPTKYKTEFNKQAYKLCLLGATDKELADYFEVSESTLNLWKINHEKFSESIKSGRVEADANVANRLYKRALGYEHKEDVIMQYKGAPVIVHTTKHYPPDTAAAFIWLKNRRSDKWMDKTVTDINSTIAVQIGEIPSLDEIIERREQRRLERGAVDAQFEVVDDREASE